MRLIDADELLTAFPVDDEPTLTKSCVRMTIQHMPTVDAIPVVRCGECKHMTSTGLCLEFADDNIRPGASDFCSCGERKDGDGNETY